MSNPHSENGVGEFFLARDFQNNVYFQIDGFTGLRASSERSLRDFIKAPHSLHMESNSVGEIALEVTITTLDFTPLTPAITTRFQPLSQFSRRPLFFPIRYRDLPLDATVVITIFDVFYPLHRRTIGGASIRLFEKMKLKTGRKTLRVWKGVSGHPQFTPGELDLVEDERLDEITRITKLKEKHFGDTQQVGWIEKKLWASKKKLLILEEEKNRNEKSRKTFSKKNEMITITLTFPQSKIPVIFFQKPVRKEIYGGKNYHSSSFVSSYQEEEDLTTTNINNTNTVIMEPSTILESTQHRGKKSSGNAFIDEINDHKKARFNELNVRLTSKYNPVQEKHQKIMKDTKEYAKNNIPYIAHKQILMKVLSRTMIQNIDQEDKDLVWMYRYWLMKQHPDSLVKVVDSAIKEPSSAESRPSSSEDAGFQFAGRKVHEIDLPKPKEQELKESILPFWNCTEIGFHDALEFLSYKYETFPLIREFAIKKILKLQTDETIFLILLQLVQALHYEKDICRSTLGKFLIIRAKKNFDIAVFLYWYLNVEIDSTEGALEKKFSDFQKKLSLSLPKSRKNDLERLIQFYEYLKHYVLNLKEKKLRDGADGMTRRAREDLSQLPENVEKLFPFPFPMDTSISVEGLDSSKCFFFSSATLPLCLSLKTNVGAKRIILKIGDDLRQDQVIVQSIKLMHEMLNKNSLNLKMTPYKILPMELKKEKNMETGFVEFIEGVIPFQKIKNLNKELLLYPTEKKVRSENKKLEHQEVEEKVRSAIRKLLHEDRKKFEKMTENFIKSCAAYCVLSWVLGFGDRHLDNLLILPNGKMLHIDFGFILGAQPVWKSKFPQIKLDNWMISSMNGLQNKNLPGQENKGYLRFLGYVKHAYSIFRKNSGLFVSLFLLLIDSKLESIVCKEDRNTDKKFDKIRIILNRLRLLRGKDPKSGRFRSWSESEAERYMIQQIERNKNSWAGYLENFTHALAK